MKLTKEFIALLQNEVSMSLNKCRIKENLIYIYIYISGDIFINIIKNKISVDIKN